MPYKGLLPTPDVIPYYLDQDIRKIEPGFAGMVEFICVDDDTVFKEVAYEADIVLLWDMNSVKGDWFPDGPAKQIVKKKKVYRIDHFKERNAGSFYLKVSAELSQDDDRVIRESRDKFAGIPFGSFKSIGYIFGTGPSLTAAQNYDFSDGTAIACNSMVKNKSLMSKLKPPIIVIADPIFHAGCSSYAGKFRRYLLDAMENGSYLIVPMRDYRLYMANLDPLLQPRIIGMPMFPGKDPNLDLRSNFSVTTTSNILTLFLIPLAATFFKKICIMGCDGRPLEQNDYFWKHDPASQLSEHMTDIQVAHPAFFNIDYNDYYLEHCNTLAHWLETAERQGREFINLTPSYIPALQARQIFHNGETVEQPLAKPAVSIIMPAFNEAKVIIEAIESVQSQSYGDWELLVVDDNSTDNTVEIIQALINKDPRIRLLKNKGKGVSSARNVGLDSARGDFITFLDADDFYYPGALEFRVEALQRHSDWNVVYCVVEMVNEHLTKLGWQLGRKKQVTFRDMSGNPVPITGLLGRAKLFQSLHFKTNLRNGEDWLYVSQILRSGEVFYKVDGGAVAYRNHDGSTVRKDFLVHENTLLKVLDLIYSPSETDIPAAPEFSMGLTNPPKQAIVLHRRIGLLSWLLFAQRLDELKVVVEEFHNQDLTVLSKSDIQNQIKYPAMRFYVCNEYEASQNLHKDSKVILELVKNSGIEIIFPQYSKELRAFISMSKKKLNELPQITGESCSAAVQTAAAAESLKAVYPKRNNKLSGVTKIWSKLTPPRSLYKRIVNYLTLNHPILARIGRFGKWSLLTLKHKLFGLGGLAILAIIAAYSAAILNEQYRWLLVGSGTGVMILLLSILALGYGHFLFYRYVNKQRREYRDTNNRIGRELSEAYNQADSRFERKLVDIKINIDGLMEDIKRVDGIQSAIDALSKEISQMEGRIGERLRQANSYKSEINQVKHAIAQVSAIQQIAISGIQPISPNIDESIKKEIAQYDIFTRKTNSSNFPIFQRFNRQLRIEDIQRFEKKWLPKLGLKFNAKALGYFAHRICMAEDTCIGRLATSIEAELLRVLVARSIQEKSLEVLEIGTLFGVGVAAIHECCRGVFENIHLTVIDPLDGFYGRNNLDVLTSMPITQDNFLHNMRRMNIPEEQLTVIAELSTEDEAIKQAAQRQYNCLIIDGDHTLFGVKHDFYNYRGMVKRGGYIIFDDYNTTDWPGIKDFVDKEVMGLQDLEFIGADWRTAVFRVVNKFNA